MKNYKYNTWHHNIAQDQKEGCCKTLFPESPSWGMLLWRFLSLPKNEDSLFDSSYSIFPTSYDFHAFPTLCIYKQAMWIGVAEVKSA